jgi:DNA-binding transcriptional LysR family regulator
VLLTHVRTGRWATVMPAIMAGMFGPQDEHMRAVPITGEDVPTIGLVYPKREPLPPQSAAFVSEAKKLASTYDVGACPIDMFDHVKVS